VVWRNEEFSFLFGTQPHAAEALGGVTPQGYLVIAGEELIVPRRTSLARTTGSQDRETQVL
jgi:hypothetical protein